MGLGEGGGHPAQVRAVHYVIVPDRSQGLGLGLGLGQGLGLGLAWASGGFRVKFALLQLESGLGLRA